ncbi:MAG TPA: hypothetical protein DC013_10685 [Ruminococcaceae bacterium]|jgi:lantibiotic modifying enzyme|nr:hypothetical protein [Oscillospiraceae bacterium]
MGQLKSIFAKAGWSDYLKGAKAAASWIRSVEKEAEGGSFWVSHPERGDQEGQIDIYHGSAGILLFFLQLADATGDPSYLEDAKRGGDYILNRLGKYGYEYLSSSLGGPHYREGTRWTFLSGGSAGVAFALTELYKALHLEKYKDAAVRITDAVTAHAEKVEGGVLWSGKSGVNFDSGTILYLLYASKFFHRPDWKETAVQAGKAILTTGRKQEKGTKYVGFVNMVKAMAGIKDDSYHVPNFAYGTSGICYTFARLYQETGEKAFLDAAKEGAKYLTSIAHVENGAALIPYRLPDLDTLYYLSNCHGVCGTARLFYLLHEITGEETYWEWTKMLAQGIIATGAPELHSPGYWHCFSYCCGTAGFTDLFLGLWLKTGDKKYLEYARRTGEVMLTEAHVEEGKASWYQMFKRIVPDEVTQEAGFYSGAAGIGAALIQLFLAKDQKAPLLRFPDEPYLSRY